MSTERDDTIAQLQKHQTTTQQLAKENESLSAVTQKLQTNLTQIEAKMQRIENEKERTKQLSVTAIQVNPSRDQLMKFVLVTDWMKTKSLRRVCKMRGSLSRNASWNWKAH